MQTTHNQFGYSLIETLIAVSILMLSIVAPMTIAIKSIQSSQYALEQNTATFLAQEAVSVVEAMRNADALDHRRNGGASSWDAIGHPGGYLDVCYTAEGCNFDVRNLDGLILNGTGVVRCEFDDDCNVSLKADRTPDAFNIADDGEDTGFVRRVYIEDITVAGVDQGIIVRVEVKWTSHFLGGDKGVEMVTSLYDRYDKDLTNS